MKRLRPVLGYTAAGLTILAAVLTPFLLIELFTRGVAATGVEVDPAWVGGKPSHVITRGAYRVTVHHPVWPRAPLQRLEPFVQLVFQPVSALPPRVSDEIDLTGDHAPDVRVAFDVPQDPNAGLRVDVTPLTSLVLPLRQAGKDSFSALIARVDDTIVVRVPLQQQPPPAAGRLLARVHNSGFAQAHDSYNGISTASDGKIYYVLSTDSVDVAARMFSYDPAGDRIEMLGDLTEACGEKGLKAVPQGKSHVAFHEAGGKLYFATHIGYYSIIDGMEKMGVPPAGYKAYQGGHLLAYDLKARSFEDLGIVPHREGVLSMTMDTRRLRIYGITWPTGQVFRFDVAGKEMKNLGTFARQGESGKGENYRTLCRSLTVNPEDGSVYFTTGDGNILRYVLEKDSVEVVEGEDLRKDYFGLYDSTSPGHMGYNWRQTFWYAPSQRIYGVHGNSGYLFSFDPRQPRVEVLARLTSAPSQRSGMFDQFSYGYLGFGLGPDGHTIHYLTGGPIYEEGRRVAGKKATAMGEAKGRENLHLVTYHIPTAKYADHGPIFFENGDRPTYVNSIAVGRDGTVYALSRITEGGRTRTDLISVKPR
ncbi:MAG: hypothetical protein AAB225_20270 [Acidobacteriota bacterium]